MKRTGLLLIFLTFSGILAAQQHFQFALVSDTHVGSETGAEDLRRTVRDINADSSLKFVIISGDITEFGSDEELHLAKGILDSLNKPLHIIPGNHDSNWSESGANSFRTIFGAETFSFQYGGYLFIGTGSGPNMRMGPGQIPRENIVWLDSVLTQLKDTTQPIVFINHYPQDSSLNNWYDVIDPLKKRNIQLILCGHGHTDRQYDFEGIPGVMGRSTLRAKADTGGFNIVTFYPEDKAVFEEKTSLGAIHEKWAEVRLFNHHFENGTARYPRPSYAVNKDYPKVKTIWQYQDKSDIGTGTAVKNNLIIGTDTNGWIYGLNKKTGKKKWAFHTGGKIYSTPAVAGTYVIVASTDHNIYCLHALTGKLIWQYATLKPVVASPVIGNRTVYIGSSDGHFRALRLKTGNLLWDFSGVKGFVVTRPLLYGGSVYFGCWANDFYALDATTGKLVWKWSNGSSNRMYSPAACYPVATHGRVFIVAPDRYMTAFDANTGRVIWRRQMPGIRVRESMGLSADSTLVYVKTMEGALYGISTTADTMEISWRPDLQLGYEICPTAIVEKNGTVFVPGQSGLVSAVDRHSGKVIWQYKTSNSLVNSIMPLKKNRVIVSTMDGKISCILSPVTKRN